MQASMGMTEMMVAVAVVVEGDILVVLTSWGQVLCLRWSLSLSGAAVVWIVPFFPNLKLKCFLMQQACSTGESFSGKQSPCP